MLKASLKNILPRTCDTLHCKLAIKSLLSFFPVSIFLNYFFWWNQILQAREKGKLPSQSPLVGRLSYQKEIWNNMFEKKWLKCFDKKLLTPTFAIAEWSYCIWKHVKVNFIYWNRHRTYVKVKLKKKVSFQSKIETLFKHCIIDFSNCRQANRPVDCLKIKRKTDNKK